MTTETIYEVRPEDWWSTVGHFADANYQQLAAYIQRLAARDGAQVRLVTVNDGATVLGASAVRIKRIPVLGKGIAYIAGGPLTRLRGEPFDPARFARVCAALRREFTERGGHILRIAAPLTGDAGREACEEAMTGAGFGRAEQAPYRTFLIDLARPLEEVNESFSRYWRRNLRRGQGNGHEVRFEQEPEAFDPLIELHEALMARKGFSTNLDTRFYKAVQEQLPPGQRLVASRCLGGDGELLSTIVLSELGDTSVGIIGATADAGAKSYASYSLFWSIISRAHERGLKWFDLGGIDPAENESVFKFKSGMRGIDVTAPGPFEATPGALTTRLVGMAERARRKMRQPKAAAAAAPTDGGEGDDGEA
ncbi:MAG: peptidoglycan bridge formation glycyltransferase FemA/FemB family protein [Phycisphaerales bacterium]|nr:peptidoglycan bridge formation glycyltransferase FemA/FemB family protein [Phycisphaerales bacterium]